MHYSSYGNGFPLFVRAIQRKNFKKLAEITGIDTGEELRTKVRAAQSEDVDNRWSNFSYHRNFWSSMNMDDLDTIS